MTGGCFPPLEACVEPSGAIKAISHGGSFQISNFQHWSLHGAFWCDKSYFLRRGLSNQQLSGLWKLISRDKASRSKNFLPYSFAECLCDLLTFSGGVFSVIFFFVGTLWVHSCMVWCWHKLYLCYKLPLLCWDMSLMFFDSLSIIYSCFPRPLVIGLSY